MTQTELPICPTEGMTKTQRGRCHERYLDASFTLTKTLMRAHALKRKSRWFYSVNGYWFFSAFVTVNLQADWMQFRAKIEVTAKPMALDPIYWHATDLADNCKKPASFRCNAAFMLEGDTFPPRFVLAQDCPPAEFAQKLVLETTDAISNVRGVIGTRTYSEFLEDKGNPKLQITKYVAALMADGRIEEAIRYIEEEGELFTSASTSCLNTFREVIDSGVLAKILAAYPPA